MKSLVPSDTLHCLPVFQDTFGRYAIRAYCLDCSLALYVDVDSTIVFIILSMEIGSGLALATMKYLMLALKENSLYFVGIERTKKAL